MNIHLSNTSQEPIYLQIKNQVKQSILRDELKEGDSLPSMRSLAKDLRISVITTKRAYEELERDGYITSVVGKGSFVAGQSTAMIHEKRLKMVEEELAAIVKESKNLNIPYQQLEELLKMLYEGEE
ncbi:GntR family transcriptional regulator [Alkalicoccobacillus gibsonii]|uniref:GntR family transcriptional regulator n=1 Tax=Alkalicoccobacillus gibsonii TaxID=79881 RepID=UPI001933CF34|nr:GntR family transcriptional regulator [Alkalicoccobacillus gibsonii]MBM0066331.1 GntR family transcriptional regulator [Alkalicoccobacillus gibsonii]